MSASVLFWRPSVSRNPYDFMAPVEITGMSSSPNPCDAY